MTTLRLACLGLVTALTLTVGATSRAQNPRPTPVAIPGPIRVASVIPKIDVTAYGAKAVVGFDNAPAFQAAHDALAKMLASATVGQRGSLYIPPALGAYDLASPVYLDAPNIVVESDGGGATLRSGMLSANGVTYVGCPTLALGYRRPATIGGKFLANFARYRPDLFGKLDTSLASAAGQRWGFRTNGNAFVTGAGTPFSHGAMSPSLGAPFTDNWAETKTLTIEFAIEGFASGQIPPNTNLFGSADANHQGTYPAYIWVNSLGQYNIIFQTQATRFGTAVTTSFNVAQAPNGGVQRVAIQIDLTHGVVAAWVNGVQQYTGACPAGGNLREAEDYPFLIGGADFSDPWLTAPNDFAVYGLSMSKTLRYKAGTNGSTQVRNSDGLPYNKILDSYRYSDDGTDRGQGNGGQTGIIGYFAFLEPPSGLSPLLSIPCGAATNFSAPAFIGLGNNGQTGLGGVKGQSVRNLNLQCVRPYGASLMIGQVLNLSLVDVSASGGMWALASLPMGSIYPIVGERLTLSSTGDAAIYLYFAIADFRHTMIQNGGRANMRFRMSDITVDGAFIAGASANCQFSVARYHTGSSGGGHVSIKNVIQDVEGFPTPSRGVVGLERGPLPSMFRLTDINAGTAPGVPFVWLDAGPAGQNWPANVVAADNAAATGVSAFSAANGPGWTLNGAAVQAATPVGLGR
jgi:hypothetical protein